jgi:hypothetical protein
MNAYRILVGKPEGKKPIRKPSHRWEDNIMMELREIGRGVMGWINLAQDRGPVEGPREHGTEPLSSIKCWEVLE